MVTAVDGTHPAGMISCFKIYFPCLFQEAVEHGASTSQEVSTSQEASTFTRVGGATVLSSQATGPWMIVSKEGQFSVSYFYRPYQYLREGNVFKSVCHSFCQ